MSEFEKELMNKVSPHDRTFKGHELFLGGFLLEHFKDWQPPKKLVEVPQFFADWFENQLKNNESKKFDGNDVFRIIQDVIKVSNDESTWEDYGITDEICEFAEDNEELFLNLIVNCSVGNGYTVKKEQLYVLKFPNRTNPYVYYVKSNMITQQCSQIEDAKRFTESEIKAIDERYWAFAVPIDEV